MSSTFSATVGYTVVGFALGVFVLSLVNLAMGLPNNKPLKEQGDQYVASYLHDYMCSISITSSTTPEQILDAAGFCAYKHSLWRQLNTPLEPPVEEPYILSPL